MQVSVETMGPLERRMSVEIPEDQISGEVETRLSSLKRSTRLDGFRPGKVPMKVVKKRFGQRVRQEVIGEVMRTSFYEAVVQEKLRPAGDPSIEPAEMEAKKGFSYTATFEVYPEVKPAPAEELKISKPHCEITDADIDGMIETLREQKRTWVSVERAAGNGDQVDADFTGFIDGEAFEGGEARGFKLEIGSSSLIAGFEDGLIGVSAGEERTLDLAFPEDYHDSEKAGKAVQFKVKVNEVAEAVLPELDDEFLKSFGVEDGNIDAIRQQVRENMERERDTGVRSRTNQIVMDALLAANPVELPNALIRAEEGRLLDGFKQNMAQQGASQSLAGLAPGMFQEQAQRRVSLGLIMAEIIQANELKAEPGKVRNVIEGFAAAYEDPAAVMKWYYDDKQRLANVESTVLEDEVVSLILQKAQVEDELISFEALMKPEEQQEGAKGNA